MKAIVKDQVSSQESQPVVSPFAVEADQPKVANIGIGARKVFEENEQYECTVQLRLSDILGIEGSALSAEIICGENPGFDITIDGAGSEGATTEQGVLFSQPINVSIPSGTEQYNIQVILYENGNEVDNDEFTAVIYFDFSE